MSEGPLQLDAVLQEEAAAIRSGGDPSRPMSALCISGGGIRSATFALGAIQSLAEYGLLGQFDYLSTVSGGGYIGGWLSAWATRANGIENIADRLCSDAPPPSPGEHDPVQHLREYNNYLSPKLGGFSADTWTLIATVVRNIALNWVVLIPLLLFFLMGPRLLMAIACLSQTYAHSHTANPDVIAKSPIVVDVLPVGTCLLFCFALFNIWRYLPGIGGHNHTGSDFMKRVLAPLSIAAILFCAYDALHFWDPKMGTLTFVQCIEATLFPAGVTWIAFLVICVKALKARLRLLWMHSLAIGLLAVSLGTAEWWVTTRLAVSDGINWAQYVTIVPPLIGVSFLAAQWSHTAPS